MRLLVIGILLAGSTNLGAATAYKKSLTPNLAFKQAASGKKNAYLNDGVFVGGKARGGSSLLGVRKAFSAKVGLERVIVDLGDKEAKPSGKAISFYQVALDSSKNRIVLDLAQLQLSKVSETQLKQIFAKSEYVKSVELTLDPEDKAATMVLNLKRPVRMEVFQLLTKDKPSRVVMDLVARKG